MEGVFYAIIFGIALALYFLPTLVGWNKKNVVAIFVLNLFLGWSIIGWVVAMVWACTKESEKTTVNVHTSRDVVHSSVADELAKLQALRGSGAISEEEFATLKSKILSRP